MENLSPREQEVADLVARGKREQEIADKLGIAKQSVKNYKQSIFKKAGARNSVELTLILNGLATDIPDLVA